MKTVKFKDPKYVGDPINAVRIFNEKEVDELLFLDIGATVAGKGPNFELLSAIASEAFMPFGYGGGITGVDQIKRLFGIGVEKVILNTSADRTPGLISEAASIAGSASVVVSIDVRRGWLGGYTVCTRGGKHDTKRDAVEWAKEIEGLGAGEILLYSIDQDGTMSGYDMGLISQVAGAVTIPVVAIGGAGNLQHFREAVNSGASAVGAGSMFVFYGRHRAVLITYPENSKLEEMLAQ